MKDKPPKKHERVHHRKLREDGVVVDVLKTGLCKVAVGSIVIDCRAEDLIPLRRGAGGKSPLAEPHAKTVPKSRGAKRPSRSASVDLHGMRVEDAVSLVERRINDALLSGADALAIIHGLGSGRLKAAVHRYLGTLSVVKRYRLDESNPGTTWAYF